MAYRTPLTPQQAIDDKHAGVALRHSERAARRHVIRNRARQGALLLTDSAILVCACLVLPELGAGPVEHGDLPTVAILPIWLTTFFVAGLYTSDSRQIRPSTLNEVPRLTNAIMIATSFSLAALLLAGSRGVVAFAAGLTAVVMVVLPIARSLCRYWLIDLLGPDRVLIAGSGLETIRERIVSRRGTVLINDDAVASEPDLLQTQDESTPDITHSISAALRSDHVDRVVLSTQGLDGQQVAQAIHLTRKAGVNLTVLPTSFDLLGLGSNIDEVDGIGLISLQPPTMSLASKFGKRVLDLVGAIGGLIVLSPIVVLTAIAVKSETSGPVLFKQRRVGRAGKEFTVLKFRTMIDGADEMVESLMTGSTDPDWLQIEDDPRITKVGRFLRSSSIDEIPQLINVIRGEMSLVGPRPLSIRDDAHVDGWRRDRLDLTPGITGFWQVLGRKDVPLRDMVKLDYIYVSNWSLWGDVKILIRTMPVVFSRRGAR